MMKLRLLSLAMAAVLCAGFVSCGDDDEEPQNPAIGNAGGASGNCSDSDNDNDNAGGDNGSDNNGGNAGGTIELVGAVADAVDLGLPNGTLWASWNVGATAPEEYGGYYAWGEIEEKDVYDWSTYKWCNGSYYAIIKYCVSKTYGTIDNKTELEPEDDVAHVMWGDGWRMPTYDEFGELMVNCTWTWTILNGVNGYMVTSKSNGNSIFMPAAGCHNGTSYVNVGSWGGCWSSSLGSRGSDRAYEMIYYDFNKIYSHYVGHSDRHVGRSVRPVKGK